MIEKFFKDIFYENGLGYISILKNWDITLSKEKFNELEENLNGTAFFDIPFKFNKFFSQIKKSINESEEDVYFSINNFMRKRETDSTWRLNCFAIDFDFYKIEKYKNLTPEQFYYDILKSHLPFEANYVINSGNGLYVIFNIYDPPPKQCTNIYKAIYKRLVHNLIEFGADAKATLITQVIRVPGTINSKNRSEVKIIESNTAKYTFRKFIDLLPYNKSQYLAYKKSKSSYKVDLRKKSIKTKLFKENTKRLIHDFERLIEMRNQTSKLEGYRELLIYLARERIRFSEYGIAEELRVAEHLNHLFENPLSDDEIYKNAKPSDLPNPSSKDTIIIKLEITEEEMHNMDYLRSHEINVKLLQQKQRKFKKQLQILKGEEKTQKRLKGIFKAIESNPKITKLELSKQFKVSERQIYRDLKYISEHKALFVDNKIILEEETTDEMILNYLKNGASGVNGIGIDDP